MISYKSNPPKPPELNGDNHPRLIKMAADTLDLIILRTLLDAAMTRSVTINPSHMFEQFIKQQEESDVIPSLSIIFERYGEEDPYEPAIFFCPDWPFDFERSVSLADALQEYLEDNVNDDDDHRFLIAKLLTVINDWRKEQGASK